MTKASWEGLAVGLLFSIAGLLLRLGIWRYGWPQRYSDKDLPPPMRNAGFALLPLGLGVLLISPSLACDPGQCSGLGYAVEPIGIALILVGVVTFFFPINILKPRWLVNIERSGGEVTDAPINPRIKWPVAIASVTVVGLLMIAAVATGWLTWSLGTFLIVLGLSVLGWMSWLTRRRRG